MAYITVQDMRDEGFSEAAYSTPLVTKRIALATSMLEKWTGQFFEPRALTLTLDGGAWGTANALLQLDLPICSITSLKLLFPDGTELDEIDPSLFKVYNRHLTEQLTNPDDRKNPRIEIVGSIYHPYLKLSAFPGGKMNIQIVGVFGYTDYDPTEDPENPGELLNPNGVTPAMIKHLMCMLTAHYLPKLNSTDDLEDRQKRSRLLSERTRDQSYTLQARNQGAVNLTQWTGNPEIDALIMEFQGPLVLGSA